MIYFDNSATTKPYKEVIESLTKVSTDYFGNPSSLHGVGREAERLLTQARELMAQLLHVNSNELIFTSGGTEGNNLAIKGIAFQYRKRGKHIITTEVEHPATYEAFKQLEDFGFEVTYLPVDHTGKVQLSELSKAIRSETILVSMIHVNNEIGAVQPIEEIGMLLKQHPKVFFHVDHVQGITKVPLDFRKAHVDLCSISSHKFHGPKGVGALFVRSGVKLYPLITGGSQEQKIRAGTENVPAIVAMTKALRMSIEKSAKGIKHIEKLKVRLHQFLEKQEGVIVNSDMEKSAPHIVNFSIIGAKPEVVIQSLNEKGIYVSTKSACSSKLSEPSRVLMACGYGKERSQSAIRVSFSFENNEHELEQFITQLEILFPELIRIMR
ncbi:cysteine desulfurase family protein [Anaerobacillus sp. MEB173]|uniref:cysteine desulfurase family protein n=1 Tax=Anaerobacillus sp. MEB173 TaxID=3383345 RepID=UPI003F8ECE84